MKSDLGTKLRATFRRGRDLGPEDGGIRTIKGIVTGLVISFPFWALIILVIGSLCK